jgi:hypothetical protein
MTSWERHHPPHDQPDFDAYLDTLTEDDLAAMHAATLENDGELDNRNDFPKF